MPDIRVEDEKGTVHVFPDGSTPEMIAQAMNVKPPEKESGSGFLSGVESSLKSMLPDTSSVGNFLKSEAGAAKMFVPALAGQAATEAAQEGIRRATRPMTPDKGVGYRAANAVSPLIPGLNPESMEARAEKGDTAGILGEAAVPGALAVSPLVKEGLSKVPVKPIVRAAGNPFGLASTGEELLTQGISPRASQTGFKASLQKAGSDLKAYSKDIPIKNVQDLNDAIPEIKQKIWSEEIEPALKRQGAKPVNMQPVADAVRKQISTEMIDFDPANAGKLETLATKLENARDVSSANSLLKYINGQLESYFQKYPAARRANLMNNPETAGWEAARGELRSQFLGTLEDAGEKGVRSARLRYGALTDVGDEVERRVNVADRAKPVSIHRLIGWASGLVSGPIGPIAGEVSHYLNKPDVLVRRGIGKLPEPAPIRTTPFGTGGKTSLRDLVGEEVIGED